MARQFKPGQLQTGSLYNISASYAVTASYAANSGTSIDTGSLVTTASFNAFTASYTTGSFTGSFIGNGAGLTGITSASYSTTASYALSASYAPSSMSSSFATTASYALSASIAQTASYYAETDPVFTSKSGSFVTTSSFNSFTASYSTGSFTGSFTGSLLGTASYATQAITASYVQTAQTASYILQAVSSSYATTASYITTAQTASYVLNSISSSYAATASLAPLYLPLTGGTISGDVTVLGTASIAFLNVQYESASVIYSSGSNQFGDATNDIQTLIGTVLVSGSQQITGSLNVTAGITGSLLGTASYATTALSASYAPSTPPFPYTGSALITGSLGVTGSFSLRAYTSSAAAIITINSTTGAQLAKIGGDGNWTLGTYTNPNTKLSATGTTYGIYGAGLTAFFADSAGAGTRIGYDSTARSTDASGISIGVRGIADGGNTTGVNRAIQGQAGGIGTNYAGYFDALGGINNFALYIQRGWVQGTTGINILAQGALSTDTIFSIRNSANTSNLGVVLGDGTINLGTSNTNYTSTYLAGRVANIGSGNAGTWNTYSKLTSIGHDNLFTSYGFFINVGNSNTINANSGGQPLVIGEGNTLAGTSVVLGHSNNIASTSTLLSGNISVGMSNTIQYEKTKTYLFGSNLRVTNAGGASMIKIGAASSTGTLSQIDKSFELYLNETSGSDFFLSGNSNLILKNNTVIVAGTHYEIAATNTNTIHSGITPTTNIADASIQYTADITAGNASPHFRTEAGNIVKLYTQNAVTSSQGIADVLTNLGFLTGSSVINPTASYATTASYALTASYLSGYVSPFPYTGSALITGSLDVTGSISITQNLTASRAYISASNGTVSGSTLTVYGSGSSQPVFTIQGSQGELFSITDSLSGSLFSVNDISGLPIMEVFSDNTTLMGSYLAPALRTTTRNILTSTGAFVVYSLPTASYDGAWFEYTAKSGANMRAGQIMSIWSGSVVNFTETNTTEFGDTSGLSFTVVVTGSNFALTGSATTTGWTIKTIIRSI